VNVNAVLLSGIEATDIPFESEPSFGSLLLQVNDTFHSLFTLSMSGWYQVYYSAHFLLHLIITINKQSYIQNGIFKLMRERGDRGNRGCKHNNKKKLVYDVRSKKRRRRVSGCEGAGGGVSSHVFRARA